VKYLFIVRVNIFKKLEVNWSSAYDKIKKEFFGQIFYWKILSKVAWKEVAIAECLYFWILELKEVRAEAKSNTRLSNSVRAFLVHGI